MLKTMFTTQPIFLLLNFYTINTDNLIMILAQNITNIYFFYVFIKTPLVKHKNCLTQNEFFY